MRPIVCAGCGAEDSIYRECEITMSGWRDVTVSLSDDGKFAIDEGPLEKGDVEDDWAGDFACSECRHTSRDIEGMVKQDDSAPLVDDVCCCGHHGHEHPAAKNYDKARFSRGRRACEVPGCGCWEFETDAALATVVRQAA